MQSELLLSSTSVIYHYRFQWNYHTRAIVKISLILYKFLLNLYYITVLLIVNDKFKIQPVMKKITERTAIRRRICAISLLQNTGCNR